ncbi:MAG: lycopene cyclase domain-containing protein [Chloroflexota bacterium]|nr:lycopene cyclase domain-containing protein [Dehalococcoidia bacterium]MDW8252561.1 lycopene cyclase domain-containing protein [Chloroflexota bacterium]
MTRLGARLGRWTYLAFITVWAMPVILFQWWFAGRDLWAKRGPLALAVAAATLYLSAADAIAIARGIWRINPARTVGLRLGPLPLEEALFFLVTNVMVAQTMVMVDGPIANRRLARLVTLLRRSIPS